MPQTLYRKVQVTVEYEAAGTGTNGELVDRVTAPLEAAASDLVKDPASGIRGYKIIFTSVR